MTNGKPNSLCPKVHRLALGHDVFALKVLLGGGNAAGIDCSHTHRKALAMDLVSRILLTLLFLVIVVPITVLIWGWQVSSRELRHDRFNQRFAELMPEENQKYFLAYHRDTGLFEFTFNRVLGVKPNNRLGRCIADDQIDWDCLDIRVSEEQIELRADTDKFRWKIQRPNARLNRPANRDYFLHQFASKSTKLAIRG